MSEERDPERDQAEPVHTQETYTQELVIDDVRERMEFGIRKYGTGLQPSNGRDSLQDAYEEALDLTIYLKNELRHRRQVAAAALREAADDWYSDDGPWNQRGSEATWLRERADRIERGE